MLKGLPKSRRKNFIPVNAFVKQACGQMSNKDGDVISALLAQIRNLKGLELSREEFECVELPAHLSTKIRVLDSVGKELAFANSIEEAKSQLASRGVLHDQENSPATSDPNHSLGEDSSYNHPIELTGARSWEFGELPEQIEIGESLRLIRYPALIDEGATVGIKLLPDKSLAKEKHVQGLVKLYQLNSIQQKNQLQKKFARLADTLVLKTPFSMKQFAEDAIWASYMAAFDLPDSAPKNEIEFDQRLNSGKSRIVSLAEKIESLFVKAVDSHFEIRRKLDSVREGSLAYVADDIESQLERLLHENFLSETSLVWFTEYPRYLKAITTRLAKAPHMGDKDKPNTELLQLLQSRLEGIKSKASGSDLAEIQTLRWMLEEFRVSLFAQTLGTRIPVSEKRINKQFDKLT